MKKKPPQEVVVLQISSPPKHPVLRKDDKEVYEVWLIGNLLQVLTPKKGSQLPLNGDVFHHIRFLQPWTHAEI